jgi:P pilus assembly chaperone PapD
VVNPILHIFWNTLGAVAWLAFILWLVVMLVACTAPPHIVEVTSGKASVKVTIQNTQARPMLVPLTIP